MGCCGQKRAQIANSSSPIQKATITQAVPDSPQYLSTNQRQALNPTRSNYSTVALRYLENSPILVRGPTGRQYMFSGANPNQSVDPRDAKALLRTRFFRQLS
jgi:hypothetical protein